MYHRIIAQVSLASRAVSILDVMYSVCRCEWNIKFRGGIKTGSFDLILCLIWMRSSFFLRVDMYVCIYIIEDILTIYICLNLDTSKATWHIYIAKRYVFWIRRSSLRPQTFVTTTALPIQNMLTDYHVMWGVHRSSLKTPQTCLMFKM